MKRAFVISSVCVVSTMLCACNTVEGFGRDLKATADYISGATDKDANNVHVDDSGNVTHE